MNEKVKVIVIGCGNMGSSHARAYHKLAGFDLVGLVDMNPEIRNKLSEELGGIDQFDDFDTALMTKKPDAVAVCTYPRTHAELTLKALESGAHVFCEKPLAPDIEDAQS
ncbi:MAG: gfo/Idh/MocA family oxidoreductase, partial [Bacteroidetes bacterium]